jgi:hypothetical protein
MSRNQEEEMFSDYGRLINVYHNICNVQDEMIKKIKDLNSYVNALEIKIDEIEKKLEEQEDSKSIIHRAVRKSLGKEVAPAPFGLKQSGIADIVDRLPTSPKNKRKRGRPKLKVVWKPGDPEEDGVGEL